MCSEIACILRVARETNWRMNRRWLDKLPLSSFNQRINHRALIVARRTGSARRFLIFTFWVNFYERQVSQISEGMQNANCLTWVFRNYSHLMMRKSEEIRIISSFGPQNGDSVKLADPPNWFSKTIERRFFDSLIDFQIDSLTEL